MEVKVEENKVNNLIRNEASKNENIEQLASENDISGKQLWRRVKMLAGWTSSLAPTKFITESGIIDKPNQMADLLNNFFCSKIENICSELEARGTCDPVALLEQNFNKWKGRKKVKTFELEPVTPKIVPSVFKLTSNQSCI